MRHRAATKAEVAGPPRSVDERSLEQVQMKLTRAQLEAARLTAQRDGLAQQLWFDRRMTQAEIAERLDRADRRSGGDGVSYAQLQKRLWRKLNGVHAAV
jgi:hypothetical protein